MGAFAESLSHLKNHVEYPANAEQVIQACNMSELPDEDREWFANSLPEKTYHGADEVLSAVIDNI
ncbi:MAG: hypothetical protein ACE5I4_03040 [Thermoplasmata archaeon]